MSTNGLAVAASLCLAGLVEAQDLPRDAFVRDQVLVRSPATDVDRLTTNMVLGRPYAEARLVAWLDHNAAAAPHARAKAWLAICAARFREQRHDEAMRACEHGEALERGSAAQFLGLLRLIRQAGPVRWSTPGLVIALRDEHCTVSHGAESVQAIFDTGAKVAVASESAARRLGGRPLMGSATIGTTTTPVAGGMVVFDTLEIGGAQLRNLSAVVLPDDLAAASELALVLGLATITSMHRAAYLDHGARLALGSAAPFGRGAPAPLYWDDSGLGFAVDLAGGRRGVHFDTGSRRTWLFPASAGALSPAERATRTPYRRRIGGLGGERVENASKYGSVTIAIAGHRWRLDEIEMAEQDESGEAMRIGTGLFHRFSSVWLDFDRMQMRIAD